MHYTNPFSPVPRIMRGKGGGMNAIRSIYCAFAMLLCVAVTQALWFVPAQAIGGYSIMSLSNSERAAMGVSGLSYSSSLAYAAQLRAQDMIDNDYWSHTSPNGSGMGYFLGAAGYPVYAAGENLSRGYDDDSSVISAWMASSGHRATILNSSYNEVGVGFVSGLLGDEHTTIVVAYYAARGPVYVAPPEPEPVVAPEPIVHPKQPALYTGTTTEQPIVAHEPIAEDLPKVEQTEDKLPLPEPVATPQHEVALAKEDTRVEPSSQSTSNFWSVIAYFSHYLELFYVVRTVMQI